MTKIRFFEYDEKNAILGCKTQIQQQMTGRRAFREPGTLNTQYL